MTKSITFKNIDFGYQKDKPIFKDLSFTIEKPTNKKGYVVGLMGGSGSGKSTILKLILGIEAKYQGDILFSSEKPVISYVPQESVLFEHLTPKENAEYFKRISNYKSHFKQDLFDKIAQTLQITDILQEAKSVNEISGGQKQRISLLRALSIAPDILLLDEPLTGLDEEVKEVFLQTIAQLVQEYQLLVIYVTHHRKEVEMISDEILYLIKDNNSEIVSEVSQSTTEQFFITPPTISALYATKRISTNVLFFKKDVNNKILFVKPEINNDDIYAMSFTEDAIHFSNDTGFEFERIISTGKYSLLKLKESQMILTVSNQKIEQYASNKFIFLTGKAEVYSREKNLQTIEIVNNQIK
ncbi:MAG: ABC transporter ATP-binding protein [Bacteroidales bacterium]|nr:ABC transporter ATP-binding protein [Bacteroidales bacterium]